MEKIKLFAKSAMVFFKENRKEMYALLLILGLGAILRFYKIAEYMTFLGDEGRDAIIVRKFLVNFDLMLIGPGTSIGQMYLGPLYYYFISPALLLFNFSPVGPSILIAFLGVITITFVWWVGREWFGKMVGIVAALLFAISPTVIIYSRSSWNPNMMPFFALLCIYAIWKVWRDRKFVWLIVLGISFAFVLQSHYLGLLLAPVLAIYWFLTSRSIGKNKPFIRNSIIGIVIFLFLMSPLLIFDARHGWNNFNAMKKFFTVRQETVSIRPWNALPKTYPIFEQINTSLLTAGNKTYGKWMTAVIVVFLGITLLKDKGSKDSFYLLFSWLLTALIGFGLYKQNIYDHYFGFIFPIPFLLFGILFQKIFESKFKNVGVGVLILLILLNLTKTPIKSAPNMQMQRSVAVAEKIKMESGGAPFNLAVIAERNYEDGYQYFLEKEGLPVSEIDAQIESSVKDQLFVVCEMEKIKCDPTHSSKAEVANFGWSKIDAEWEVMGVTIYKLTHVKE